MIKVKKVTRVFKTGEADVHALRGVSFDVHSGDFVAITGRSGSGKSTLMYQMSALDFPTSGTIEIDGIDITQLSHQERTDLRLNSLGYVFQDYALLPELTAAENVMVPLLMQGLSVAAAREKSISALSEVGLSDRVDNRPGQLSGGQQQRVSIARAIAHDPKIIFADEPTANLDSETSKTVIDIFFKLNKKGQTIVMVTHETDYAGLTDRVLHMSDGEIIKDTKHR